MRMSHLTGEGQTGEEHPQGCTVKKASLDLVPWQSVLGIHVPIHSAVFPLQMKRPQAR